ncbi:ATP-binding protein [Comamonas terrae]|uniref:histidine kinase n=1 Tax=Comamonas terrae TaxID=673548 RepID=A0ABW5UNT2_9BURK|nr:ATP-binding protein [Comamonas terrae]
MKNPTQITIWIANRSEPLLSQIPQAVLQQCVEQLPSAGTLTTVVEGKKSRILRKSVDEYSAIAFSVDVDRIKSKKLLESEIDAMLAVAPTVELSIQRSEGRTRRLLHNLKSLTAKTSQEVFLLAQQDRLIGNPREVVPYLASEIRDNLEGTARALLEILKHQAAQKAEYTAFDRLSGKLEKSNSEMHDVHRVLMNVFYLFFGEFIAKKVRAEVERTRIQARFDYDSIHVCIYYLVENAAKYTRPDSDFSVSVSQSSDGFVDIRFVMESLAIKPDEQDLIFEEGYSGSNAIDSKLHGAGLGLYLARSMARINYGNLNVLAGLPLRGSQYARNTFVLTIPGN